MKPVQYEMFASDARFKVNPAGRRSGKSELCKFRLVLMAGTPKNPCWGRQRVLHSDAPRYFCAAPTFNQAKRIYWEDLKRITPRHWLSCDPREGEMRLDFKSGASIMVMGMDKPERIEGSPWDGGILDEYGNMKEKAWKAHVRPALSDRNGWCWLIGVPEGRNHYYETYRRALRDESGEWAAFTWKSSEVLPPHEIEAARQDLDELTFLQEYEASFVTFEGRAYHAFNDENQSKLLRYDPLQPLIICFDFNVAPGVAAVAQEQSMPGQFRTVERNHNGVIVISKEQIYGTGAIGEVWVPRNSNTEVVCKKLIQDWENHQGLVTVYGDSTGGSRGSAKLSGSDWDIVKECFRRSKLHDKIRYRIPRQNPQERVRLNAVNSRCRSVSGEVKFMVDPTRCPHIVQDFEGVRLLEGGSGEIDKSADPMLTHISDALGYYIVEEFPIRERTDSVGDF